MKKRIDILVSEKFNLSRNKSQELIAKGLVYIDEQLIEKPSFVADEEDNIILKEGQRYVSRGAYKLLGAIEKFNLDFKDKVVMDIGASTGGFTQVCLLAGAKKVYAVDVGKGELDKSLAKDERVVNLEGRDVRSLVKEDFKDVDIIVGDISFISLTYIIPKIKEMFGKIQSVLLFKPQFECGKELAKKYKGVINDKKAHKDVLKNFVLYLKSIDFVLSDLTSSPIKGKQGNIEYLLNINALDISTFDVDKIVENVFKK